MKQYNLDRKLTQCKTLDNKKIKISPLTFNIGYLLYYIGLTIALVIIVDKLGIFK